MPSECVGVSARPPARPPDLSSFAVGFLGHIRPSEILLSSLRVLIVTD